MGPSPESLESLAIDLLKPARVTPRVIAGAVRRAKRAGAYWSMLSPLERALLEAASRARLEEYRSPVLRSLLATLVARIEAHTLKGLVLLKGLWYALSRGLVRPLLHEIKGRLDYIKYLGKSLLTVEEYFTPLPGS